MRIGILGGGRVGSALAATWRAAGHDVQVSTRATLTETAASADVLLLAVPSTAAPDVLDAVSPLAGKIVIDATNSLSGGPDGLTIARHASPAKVVKAFNTVFANYFHETPPATPASMVLCGDDEGALAIVKALVGDAGFEPISAGGSEATPDVEAFARLVIGIAYRQGRGPFVYRFEAR